MSRILLWFHHFRTPRDVGGLRSWHIGRALVQAGHDVDAVIPGVDSLTGKTKTSMRKGNTIWREDIDGVNVNWVKAAKNRRATVLGRVWYFITSTLWQLIAAFKQPKPDLVISMSVPLSALVASGILARIRGSKFMVDVRDTHIDSAVATGFVKQSLFVRFCMVVEAHVFRRADLCITVTDGMKEMLEAKGVSPEKLLTIHLGFDGDGVYDACTDWTRNIKDELGLASHHIVLYSGSLGKVFDLETILKAAQKLSHREDIKFVFLGGGQDRERWERFAKHLHIDALFVGEKPKSDVPLFCQAATVAVYAVKDRTPLKAIAGNKVFDYLGSGTPIVCACNDGEVAKLIDQSGGGEYVSAENTENMAERIEALCDDPSYAAKLGQQARHFACTDLSAEKMMHRFTTSVERTLS